MLYRQTPQILPLQKVVITAESLTIYSHLLTLAPSPHTLPATLSRALESYQQPTKVPVQIQDASIDPKRLP